MADGNVIPLVTGLTAAQKEARKDRLGGSDANRIVKAINSGKPEDIDRLIKEKRGEIAPENIDEVFRVELGQYTEPYNLYRLNKQSGLVITHTGQSRKHPKYYWMGNTLDGMTILESGEGAVVQAKHTAEFVQRGDGIYRVTLADKVEDYTAQLMHEMIVCGVRWAILSVIFGNAKLEYVAVPLDDEYAERLIEIEREIWDCVVTGKRWRDMPPPPNPELPAILRKSKPVDMTGNNEWADAAAEWLRTKPGAEAFKVAEARFKGDRKGGVPPLIPEAVREAYGYGVKMTRSVDGKLKIVEHKGSADTPPPAPQDDIPHFDDFLVTPESEY